MIRVNIMNKGDEVISVTSDFIAVKRRKGEVDIVPLVRDGSGLRVDVENIVTIGYGDNTVTVEEASGLKVTNF